VANLPDEIHPPQALHRLLPCANALFICLPLTPATTGLIGAKELALLPPHAVLVNVARGPIVDEAALYHALRDGALHAAGLDVWYNYPPDEAARAHTPPSDYPFHELDNVVMSPHRAGGSTETELQRMAHLARLLNAAARGEEMPNRVDLQAGY
jgi:phosphoglycerate dehydrogenase-like enzyme